MKNVFCFLLLSLISVDGFYNSIILNNNRDEVQEQPVWDEVYSRIPFWLHGRVPQRVSDNQVDLGLSDINSESSENDLDYFINTDSGPVYVRNSEEADKILDNQDYHTSNVFTILNDVLRTSKPSDFKFEDNYEVSDTNQTVYIEDSSSIVNENGYSSQLSSEESSAGSSISPKNYTDNLVVVDSPYAVPTDYEYQSSFGEQDDDKQMVNNSWDISVTDSSQNNADVHLEADIYGQESDDLIAMENSWDAGNYVLNLPEYTKDTSSYGSSNTLTYSADEKTAADFGDVIAPDNGSVPNNPSSSNFESNHSKGDVVQKDFSEINRSNDRFAGIKFPDNAEETLGDDTVGRLEDIIAISKNQQHSDVKSFLITEINNDSKIEDSSSVNVQSKDFHLNSLKTQTISTVDSDKFYTSSTSLAADPESKEPKSIDALFISPDELLNYMEDSDEREITGNSAYQPLDTASIDVIQKDASVENFPKEEFQAMMESENINKNGNETKKILSGNPKESTPVISTPELHESPANRNAGSFKANFVDGWILNNSENRNKAIPDKRTKNNKIPSVNQNEAESQSEQTLSHIPKSQELPTAKLVKGMINVQNSESSADNDIKVQSESGKLQVNEIKPNPRNPPCTTSGNCLEDVDINSTHLRNSNIEGSIDSSIKPKWNNDVQQRLNPIPDIQGEWFDGIPKTDEEERVKLSDAIVSTLRGPEKESSVYKRVLEYTVGDALLDKALISESQNLSTKTNKGPSSRNKILIAANKTIADNSSSKTTGASNINDDANLNTNISFPKYSDNLSSVLNDNLKLQPSNMKAVGESKPKSKEPSEISLTGAKVSNYTDSSIMYEVHPRKAINHIKNASTDIFFREWNAEEINVLSANSKTKLPENLAAYNPNSKQNKNFYLPFDILNENEEAIDLFNPDKVVQSVQTPKAGKVVDRSRSDIPIEEDEDYMDQNYDYDS